MADMLDLTFETSGARQSLKTHLAPNRVKRLCDGDPF